MADEESFNLDDIVIAEFDFENPENIEDAITLQEGDRLTVTDLADLEEGWLTGVNQRTGDTGLFPATYVKHFEAIEQQEPQLEAVEQPSHVAPQQEPDKKSFQKQTSATQKIANKVKKKPTAGHNGKFIPTVYGAYAVQLAQLAGVITCGTGAAILAWHGDTTGNAKHQWPGGDSEVTTTTLVLGLVCFFVGLLIAVIEAYKFKKPRAAGFPKRVLIYLPLAIFLMIFFPTIILSVMWFIVVGVWITAWRHNESYEPPKSKKKDDYVRGNKTKCQIFCTVVGGRNPEGRVGRVFCVVTYFCINVILGIIWHADAAAAIQENLDNGLEAMTGWVPWAKFFGVMMDFNFTFIFLPVAHTFIKSIFAVSTDQSNSAILCRKILYLIPLDQALKLHKLMGYVGATSAVCHTVCHLMNYGRRADLVWTTYGAGVWITGSLLLLIIFMLVPATKPVVKRGQFEIFWFTHWFYIPFIILNLLHGAGWWGPHYWKFLLAPGGIFFSERIFREYKRRQPCRLYSFTRMKNPDVISLAFVRDGPLKGVRRGGNQLESVHREGQYAFINCPSVSTFEWHPMTISAAPNEPYVTFHIRVQGPGSWTRQVMEFMMMYTGGKNFKAFMEHAGSENEQKGQLKAITGKKWFCIDGPYSAPTQHLKQYMEVMICASGIGVTPLAATMKSVVHHIWARSMGTPYPSGGNFYWVCSYRDISSFKWFLRTIREACDKVAQYDKTGVMANKHFTFHLYLTSYDRMKKAGKLRADDWELPEFPPQEKADETEHEKKVRLAAEDVDIAFWGKKYWNIREDKQLLQEKALFNEKEMWKACTRPDEWLKQIKEKMMKLDGKDPSKAREMETYGWRQYRENKEDKKIYFGPLTIYSGYPNWDEAYEAVAKSASRIQAPSVGVMFCGAPGIGKDLKRLCDVYTTQKDGAPNFFLHKEVF